MNSNLLKSKFVEQGLKMKDVAKTLKIDQSTLNRKIQGSSEFSRPEIQGIKKLLQLNSEELDIIFFN